MVERHFLAVPQGCLRFVIVVFPDHTHFLFFIVIVLNICKTIENVNNIADNSLQKAF